MIEKTISIQSIYEGRIIKVRVEEVELPNGKTASREIVHHNGAVAVLAVTNEDKIVLVRQYRKPMDQIILEVPAGKLEGDEDPKACAERELIEETGFKAKDMKRIASFYTSPGFSDELVHLYRGRGLTAGEAQPDEDEFVEVLYISLPEAKKYIETGEIKDAKTIMAIYAWELDK